MHSPAASDIMRSFEGASMSATADSTESLAPSTHRNLPVVAVGLSVSFFDIQLQFDHVRVQRLNGILLCRSALRSGMRVCCAFLDDVDGRERPGSGQSPV